GGENSQEFSLHFAQTSLGKLPAVFRGTLPAVLLGTLPGHIPVWCRSCHLQYERSCPMTLIALTEWCRLLGIDGKTLRRWLAQAQLPVEAHPSDARCKGLARDHHRSLAGMPAPWPASTASAETSPGLSAELLTA